MANDKRQRIDKILANMGWGTRKEIKKRMKTGSVVINGKVIQDPGFHVLPNHDRIEIDGELVTYQEYIYLMMNKPAGVLSATEDRFAEVVTDLLDPIHQHFEPFPVGRLDKDTEGLLILTNDGKLAHQLLSPKKHVPKLYYAMVEGEVTEADILAFRQGVILDDGYLTMPSELEILQAGKTSEVELTIYEGKFHQVKRMFIAVGKKVKYLKRLAMGSLYLDPDLEPGEYLELTEEDIAKLKEDVKKKKTY
ncbi:pseudouridine synthase [Thermoflavimicrobium daqui]|jgi:16S rRNA pseudouridine516 synthase|uniref:Pseudouridine synthase n=1 Tax=Thermoflavimicrobium daqui TaxID=2137476 RepID=A0A364K4H0_9BACL|nr:pseudouridine synthase [Thermoflavimicrobium daqui]RAL24274.1 16S rRNA pseudouridine(516) synthase [Thermoflavimicrobium daqui]